jgi:hypothetical protein
LAGAGEWVEKPAFSWYICTHNNRLFGLLLGVGRAKPLEINGVVKKKAVVKKWLIS